MQQYERHEAVDAVSEGDAGCQARAVSVAPKLGWIQGQEH
jgi:hypothetical protein